MSSVGRRVPRLDGWDKVTGAAKYVDDLVFPDLWYGATVRSTDAHSRLKAVHYDPSFDWKCCVTVTASDIPGDNVVALIEDDQPALAAGEINHVAEAVVLIAAPTLELAREAARHVRLETEPLASVLSLDQATHVFKQFEIKKGDVEAALAAAHRVVEGVARTGAQEQLYIEPQGVVAVPLEGGGMKIVGSLQCPFYVHRAMMRLLGLPSEKVAIVQSVTGGGFGGKEEYPSMIAGHAALLARKAGRPVKIVYDRQEDIAATTKRHPSVVRHRTGIDRDGNLVAMDIEVVMDGGAYCTLSPVVLSRGTIHAAGAYSCPNVRIRSRVMKTHTPPHGAFRGFGAPQTLFAVEMQIERCARAIGVDPIELRRRWMLRDGQTTATGQPIVAGAAAEVLDGALTKYRSRVSPPPAPGKKRGVGVALYLHGAGFTGSGEEKLKGRAAVRALDDGTFEVLAGSTEIGQGTRTIFAQIAADALGVEVEKIRVVDPDTSKVPDSGPTVASRTTMVVGRVVEDCAKELRRRLSEGVRIVEKQYAPPPGIKWDDATYSGDAYPVYAWGANVAEVDVDPDTGEIEIVRLIAAADCGKVVHPVLAEGQIEGGAVQALGWATIEEVKYKDGRVWNDRLATYIIPTSADVPMLETVLIEKPFPFGPAGGAKGIGELPMDGPGPAIAAAVANAIGKVVAEIPLSPERVLEAME